MRKILGLLWITALTMGAPPSPAGGAPFEGTLGISIGTFAMPPFTGTSSGTNTANRVVIPSGALAGTGTLSVIGRLPGGTPIVPITRLALSIALNGRARFTGDPLAGRMPLAGTARVKGNVGAGSTTLAAVPLFTNHALSSGADEIGIGVGGSLLLTLGGDPNLYLKVLHASWSAGMKTVTGLPNVYTFHASLGAMASQVGFKAYTKTAMYTGSDARTPGGVGQVTLVSPTKMTLPPGDFPFNNFGRSFVMLGTLTLNLVPEPGTLLLLALGVAALGALGRQRMHRD